MSEFGDEEAWRIRLTPEQYQILRCSATEAPFTGAYWDHHEEGRYRCAGCEQVLFLSDDKYDSGSGWPSFTRPVEESRLTLHRDDSHGMERIEVRCASCGGHLGHLFPDGPNPTGQRYCVNSASLEFEG